MAHAISSRAGHVRDNVGDGGEVLDQPCFGPAAQRARQAVHGDAREGNLLHECPRANITAWLAWLPPDRDVFSGVSGVGSSAADVAAGV
jgi:hypothetical protein